MVDESVACFIDWPVLRDIISGKTSNASTKISKMLKETNDVGRDLKVFTNASCFMRAIWLAEPTASIQHLQKVLSYIEILPSRVNYKNEQEVLDEILEMLNKIGKLQEKYKNE